MRTSDDRRKSDWTRRWKKSIHENGPEVDRSKPQPGRDGFPAWPRSTTDSIFEVRFEEDSAVGIDTDGSLPASGHAHGKRRSLWKLKRRFLAPSLPSTDPASESQKTARNNHQTTETPPKIQDLLWEHGNVLHFLNCEQVIRHFQFVSYALMINSFLG